MYREMSLLELPNELLLEIINKHFDNEGQIYSFICTNRRLYSLGRRELYRFNAANNNSSAVHFAASLGNLKTILYAHEHGGAVLDAVNHRYNGASPLHLASRAGHMDVIDFLLARGVPLNTRDKYYYTPLGDAVRMGHLAIVERLLAVAGVDPCLKDSSGRPPLWWACRDGHLRIVQALLRRGGIDLGSSPIPHVMPLFIAAAGNHVDVVATLLADDRVDPNPVAGYPGTPLMVACRKGHERVIQMLLNSRKTDIQHEDSSGRQAIFYAVVGNHARTLDILLDHGALIDAMDHSGWTAIHVAARNGLVDMAYKLIARGADPSGGVTEGWTPLCWAAFVNRRRIINLLLDDHRVDANYAISNGSTAMHIAAMNGSEALELFLDREVVDVNSQDNLGRTPLILAVQHARLCHIEPLIMNERIDVNRPQIEGPRRLCRQRGRAARVSSRRC
jgi:ankyrin repeat protein